MKKDQLVIPDGIYCHGMKNQKNYICPYWSKRKDKPEQENGYCSFLKEGDWEDKGSGLLWDQVKECNINIDFEKGE